MTRIANATLSEKPRARITSRTWNRIREIGLGYTLLAPALIILIVFEIFPVFYGLYISACNWKLSCTQFIGIDNYTRAFDDSDMWNALGTTVTYSVISVPLQLGLGLVIAYLLFQKIRGKDWLRVFFFLPYITSTVASAAVWAYLYSPDRGLFNTVLRGLGLPAMKWLSETKGIFLILAQNVGIDIPSWLNGPSLALLSLIIYTTWVFVGYDVAIFLAGLGNIPAELYEAAKIDGANGWKLFRHITIPLLSPTTFFLLILTVIGTFKAFNHIYVMTKGGPGNATSTMGVFIFQQMYESQRYGYSAALSFILFGVILLLTILQNRLAGERVVYD
jgi:multiple sugar transport system permease protein